MKPIERMVKQLTDIPALGGRVYPVVAPDAPRRWPICVWARSGGAAVTMIGGDGPKLPLVQVDVLADRYGDVEATMAEVVAVLRTWLTPEPPTDSWDEELGVYRQMVVVALPQE